MKKFLLLFCLVLTFSQCWSKIQVKDSSIIITISNIEKLDLYKTENTDCFMYSAEVVFLNNTDSVIRSWEWTCSWQDNWIFTLDSMMLFYESCPKNFPHVVQLNPRERLVFKCSICVESSIDFIKGKTNKLGFVLIRENEITDFHDFEPLLMRKEDEKKDIFWSNPFKIDK